MDQSPKREHCVSELQSFSVLHTLTFENVTVCAKILYS
jgi:hypothetical protein